MSGEKLYVDLPPFTGRNVPVTEIAKAMHKDAQYVRVGLQQGILRFGYAAEEGPSPDGAGLCQLRVFPDFNPPSLVVCQMPVHPVQPQDQKKEKKRRML